MSLKAYLAEKYMSGPKADAILSKVNPPKKKKRKRAAEKEKAPGSLSSWATTSIKTENGPGQHEVSGRSKEERVLVVVG